MSLAKILCRIKSFQIKKAWPDSSGHAFMVRLYRIIYSPKFLLRDQRPTAAEPDGGSCCSATERSAWRRRTIRLLLQGTASLQMRNGLRP